MMQLYIGDGGSITLEEGAPPRPCFRCGEDDAEYHVVFRNRASHGNIQGAVIRSTALPASCVFRVFQRIEAEDPKHELLNDMNSGHGVGGVLSGHESKPKSCFGGPCGTAHNTNRQQTKEPQLVPSSICLTCGEQTAYDEVVVAFGQHTEEIVVIHSKCWDEMAEAVRSKLWEQADKVLPKLL